MSVVIITCMSNIEHQAELPFTQERSANSHILSSAASNGRCISEERAITLDLPDADVRYYPAFIANDVAWAYYECLLKESHWRQETLRVFGKLHLAPRLSSWVGDAGIDYSYSQMTMHPLPWTPLLLNLKARVEAVTKRSFNSVLLNYYRNGKDSNGWHSDDEPELATNPVIASLSFGAPRDFHLRHKTHAHLKYRMSLVPGSLLVMQENTQRYWQHQIPKRAKAEPRINLTFRKIVC